MTSAEREAAIAVGMVALDLPIEQVTDLFDRFHSTNPDISGPAINEMIELGCQRLSRDLDVPIEVVRELIYVKLIERMGGQQ